MIEGHAAPTLVRVLDDLASEMAGDFLPADEAIDFLRDEQNDYIRDNGGERLTDDELGRIFDRYRAIERSDRDHWLTTALEQRATQCVRDDDSATEALRVLRAKQASIVEVSPHTVPKGDKALRKIFQRAKEAWKVKMAERLAAEAIEDNELDDQARAHEAEVQRRLDGLRASEDAKDRLAEERLAARPLPPVDVGSLDEMLERGDETKWRVEGVQPVDGRVLVVAQRKAGKTTLVGNLAKSLLDGEPFLGKFPVSPIAGSLVILNYEVSGPTLAKWLADMGFSADARRRLRIVNLRGRENLLATEAGREKLVTLLKGVQAEYLVVDVFARAFSGNQDSNSEVAAWLGELDRVATDGGAREVVLVAHAGWGASGRSRGASALEDWPDSIVNLEMDRDVDTDATGPRYVKAFGRDVDIEKSRLDFDSATRLLTYSGITRAAVRNSKKNDELSEPILAVVKRVPGVTVGLLSKQLRVDGVPFRDTDLPPARRALVASGLVVEARDGKQVHLYLPDNVPEKFRLDELDPGGPSAATPPTTHTQ